MALRRSRLTGLASGFSLTGQELGTLGPRVYTFSSSRELTGGIVLNVDGRFNASFVFQTGPTLATASNSTVTAIDGGTNDNICWEFGSSATLGTGTGFIGTIVADTGVTLTTAADISRDRAIALTGIAIIDANTVSNSCLNGRGKRPPRNLIAAPSLYGPDRRRSRRRHENASHRPLSSSFLKPLDLRLDSETRF